MEEIKINKIKCSCGGKIFLQSEVKEGRDDVVQIFVKCEKCDKSGFIKNDSLYFDWSLEEK
jgi:hypothetical protein